MSKHLNQIVLIGLVNDVHGVEDGEFHFTIGITEEPEPNLKVHKFFRVVVAEDVASAAARNIHMGISVKVIGGLDAIPKHGVVVRAKSIDFSDTELFGGTK